MLVNVILQRDIVKSVSYKLQESYKCIILLFRKNSDILSQAFFYGKILSKAEIIKEGHARDNLLFVKVSFVSPPFVSRTQRWLLNIE